MSDFAPARKQNAGSLPWPAARQAALGILLGIPAFVVIAIVALAIYNVAHRDVIYPAVSINGIDIGGVTPAVAKERLDGYFRGYAERPLTLYTADQTWSITPAALGLRTDTEGLTREAYQIGREGSPLDRLVAPLRLRQGSAMQASPTLAPDALDRTLAQLAAEYDRPAVNARLTLAEQGVTIEESSVGRRLNRDLTARRLTSAVEGLRQEPVELAVEPVQPAVLADMLRPAAQQGQAILDQSVALTFADQTYPVDPDVIREALRFTGTGAATRVELDPAVLGGPIAELSAVIDRPARDASLTIRDGRVIFAAGETALTLHVDASTAALRAALLGGEAVPELVVEETPPDLTAADFETARRRAETILQGPVVVTGRHYEWALQPKDLAELIILSPPANGEPAAISFDQPAIKSLVAKWAGQVDQSAVSPKLNWNGGQIQIVREGRRGYALKEAEAAAALIEAARSEKRTVQLPIVQWGADVTPANVHELGLKEVVAEGQTSYAGSMPERAHNVELAAQRIHGTLIAPGEQFSFNRALGPTTLETGFKWGFGIVSTGQGLRTVPSVAGGICQVATTLFQPVFWAGYQIDQRVPHSYWIPKYESKGMPGLDTTVDDPSGVDFRFTNNSPHHLLIQAHTAGEKLQFALVGTKPNWDVKVLDPVIRDRVPADQTVVQEPSDWLPAGQTLTTESAADGFTVTITRVVTANGQPRQTSLTSHYQPARNVVLVGTGQNGGQRAATGQPTSGQPTSGQPTSGQSASRQ